MHLQASAAASRNVNDLSQTIFESISQHSSTDSSLHVSPDVEKPKHVTHKKLSWLHLNADAFVRGPGLFTRMLSNKQSGMEIIQALMRRSCEGVWR